MSESSEKLIPVSRRQLSQRRRSRTVQKVEPKKPKSQEQPKPTASTVAITRINHNINPSVTPSGKRRSRSGVVTPPVVTPLPNNRIKKPATAPNAVPLKTIRMQKPGLVKMEKRPSRKTRLKPMARTMLYALRLLIVGVGMGSIVGTLLSILDPASRIGSVPQSNLTIHQNSAQSNPLVNPPSLNLTQEIPSLKTSVSNLATANANLSPGILLVDLDNGNYVDINSTASFPAASTIKVPILIAFFQDVDAGKITLSEKLTMAKEMIAGGSGNLQYQAVGSQYSALEIATKMITISDNTATNMLIARLGGKDALNERFRKWGLTNTVINNQLPDLAGTNTTSPKELALLMAMVNQGNNLVSMRSRDMMLDIMRRTERDNLLPSGLGDGAKAYHKTGDIGTMLADAGLIDVLTGKRYIAAVMVKRPNNDPSAEKLISSISRTAYQYFSQAAVTPAANTTPPVSTTPNVPVSNTPNLPTNNYQSPPLVPNIPNGTINNVPMGNYQAPILNQQPFYSPGYQN
ncbi:beta-lactamase [Richelia sinica FACHB-800]|uniref:Beta-lactamase n=1 Tax=Richelia sinica FACHB-800 TaxID=1357546 RepID=A0A975Y6K0_9NOST|nr:serine hydrolase [Richelia sinica]MBD2664783.1 serine hydrolase [Richelia sinica FACHB-800]QXE25334.1 beta-lactamase [Richelia sinica FACHB-800]